MKKHGKKKHKHRNNGGGGSSGASAPRATPRRNPRRIGRGDPPDFWTTVAAVAGGAGSAVISGLVVNQKILSPEASAIGLIGVGGATAYFADGNARVVGNSMASAGAGQLALALMTKRAVAQSGAGAAPQTPATATAAAPQLPAPQPQPAPTATAPNLANNSRGGGYVVDMFRDAASTLDMLDEEARCAGMRDGADGGADVYDLDDLAAA